MLNYYRGNRTGQGKFTRKIRSKAYNKMRRQLRKAGRRSKKK